MYDSLIGFIRDLYQTNESIPLHRPYFNGNEKKYLEETINSTFVSSVGPSVNSFESKIAEFHLGDELFKNSYIMYQINPNDKDSIYIKAIPSKQDIFGK